MKAGIVQSGIALVLGLISTRYATAGTENPPLTIPATSPSTFFSVVRVFGALALVFALFLAGIWLFRNWQRLTINRGTVPKLNVIEVKSLGPRHALYVVGYDQQRFLLSSAPSGVTLLTHLPSAVENNLAEPATSPQPNFLEIFTKAVARK